MEIKKASLPPGGVPYPPERMQVGLQALLLLEHGHQVERGYVYYAASGRRLEVPVDRQLLEEVRTSIVEAGRVLRMARSPAPLEDSPKCWHCSLNGICLPDETRLLTRVRAEPAEGSSAVEPRVRRLLAPVSDSRPVYIQEPGAQVGKKSRNLIVSKHKEVISTLRLIDLSQLVLCGPVGISASAIQALLESDIPIVHLSGSHWFHGVTRGHGLKNAFDRAAQFSFTSDPAARFGVAGETEQIGRAHV